MPTYSLTLRATKGSKLTTTEMDNNLLYLQNLAESGVGPQGHQGLTGPQGATGPQGNSGYQGATGPQGNQGTIGATGSQGNDGNQGPRGATGPQGNVGRTLKLSANDFEYNNLDPGTGARCYTSTNSYDFAPGMQVIVRNTSYSMTGNVLSNSANLVCVIPEPGSSTVGGTNVQIVLSGFPGLTGPQGNTGPQGPTGGGDGARFINTILANSPGTTSAVNFQLSMPWPYDSYRGMSTADEFIYINSSGTVRYYNVILSFQIYNAANESHGYNLHCNTGGETYSLFSTIINGVSDVTKQQTFSNIVRVPVNTTASFYFERYTTQTHIENVIGNLNIIEII